MITRTVRVILCFSILVLSAGMSGCTEKKDNTSDLLKDTKEFVKERVQVLSPSQNEYSKTALLPIWKHVLKDLNDNGLPEHPTIYGAIIVHNRAKQVMVVFYIDTPYCATGVELKTKSRTFAIPSSLSAAWLTREEARSVSNIVVDFVKVNIAEASLPTLANGDLKGLTPEELSEDIQVSLISKDGVKSSPIKAIVWDGATDP